MGCATDCERIRCAGDPDDKFYKLYKQMKELSTEIKTYNFKKDLYLISADSIPKFKEKIESGEENIIKNKLKSYFEFENDIKFFDSKDEFDGLFSKNQKFYDFFIAGDFILKCVNKKEEGFKDKKIEVKYENNNIVVETKATHISYTINQRDNNIIFYITNPNIINNDGK